MAINYFIGKSRAWLENELAKVQADLAAGKVVTSVTAGGDGSSKTVEVPAEKRFERLIIALNAIAPDDYPLEGSVRVSRTYARFS